MSRWLATVAIIFAIPFLTGFFFSKTKIDAIQGVWKTEQPEGGVTRFITIGDNYFLIDAERMSDLVYEEKDGVVVIRNAGIDTHIGRVFIRDTDHIELELTLLFGGKFKLVRSNEKEMNETFNPPVSKIIGHYSSEDGKLILNVTEDAITRNGSTVDGNIIGSNRQYYAVADQKVLFQLIPMSNGFLKYDAPPLRDVILSKITDADAKLLLMKKQEEQQTTIALLVKARGLWAAKDVGRNTPWKTIEITESELIKDGKSIPVVGKVINEEAVLCPADRQDQPILVFKEISIDGNRITFCERRDGGFSSFTDARSYERITPDEFRMRNEPKLEDLKGFWKLENEDVPACRILAFESDRVMRDGHVEPIESRGNSPTIRINRQNERGSFVMMNVNHPSKDQIDVCYGEFAGGTWFTYRRLAPDEIKAEMQKTNNIIGKLSGYWKSAEPVLNGQYAYIRIQLNQSIKGKYLDTFDFLGTNGLNGSNTTRSSGVLGYPDGKTDKPIYRLGNSGWSGHDSFVLVDDNKMTYKETMRDPIDFIRINENDAPTIITQK